MRIPCVKDSNSTTLLLSHTLSPLYILMISPFWFWISSSIPTSLVFPFEETLKFTLNYQSNEGVHELGVDKKLGGWGGNRVVGGKDKYHQLKIDFSGGREGSLHFSYQLDKNIVSSSFLWSRVKMLWRTLFYSLNMHWLRSFKTSQTRRWGIYFHNLLKGGLWKGSLS